jgi:predicted CxxxxCH...CXXCH cytochrome family protein
MKKITIIYLTILVFGFAIFIQSCSQVEDNLVTSPSIGIHPAGWLTKSSPNFHGLAISSNKWDFSPCKTCHAPDFRGGSSGASCFKCHPDGPQACNVCHGNPDHSYPPAALNGQTLESYIGVGVHEAHLGDSTNRFSRGLKCFECHRAFTDFNDTVHINPLNIDNRAEVVFDTLAKTPTGGITPNPVWDRTTATCSGVYCHGNFTNGNYRLLNPPPVPVWTNPESVFCGFCHGNIVTGDPLPGGTHFQNFTINECWYCHERVIDSTGNIFNKSLHVDGIIEIGVSKNKKLK